MFFAISLTPQLPFAPAFPAVLTGIPQGVGPTVQDITAVSPDFATLYSVNANVSISREIGPDLAVTATYLYTRGNRLPVMRNVNLVPPGQQLADGRPFFPSARVFPSFGNILVAESVGQSVYNGLNLTLNKRLSHGLEMFATYTWSHAIDDAPEQNNIDSPNFLLSDPTNRRRDRGDSLTDRRHAFNCSLVYTPSLRTSNRVLRYFVNGNRIAVIAKIQSGDVFNMGSNRVLNGDHRRPTPSSVRSLSGETLCVRPARRSSASGTLACFRSGGQHRRVAIAQLDRSPGPAAPATRVQIQFLRASNIGLDDVDHA